jgi:TetR/AcrR family transcriptional regulator
VTNTRPGNRAQSILETLAKMLEDIDSRPITTAALASEVGVSEAALYRHFPSKGRIYRGLIEYIEESLFTHVRRILDENRDAEIRCGKMISLYLGFAEHNPGLCRVITGDALCNEKADLRRRARKINASFETQLKQVFREAMYIGARPLPATESAQLLMSIARGRVNQYIDSDYKILPLDKWGNQWTLLSNLLFVNLDRNN